MAAKKMNPAMIAAMQRRLAGKAKGKKKPPPKKNAKDNEPFPFSNKADFGEDKRSGVRDPMGM